MVFIHLKIIYLFHELSWYIIYTSTHDDQQRLNKNSFYYFIIIYYF